MVCCIVNNLQGKAKAADSKLAVLQKELDTLERAKKQSDQDSAARELRLNRALEEIEKYKSKVQSTKIHEKDATAELKQQNEKLAEDNRRLEKQKIELIAAFKKQLKLIDILKRQRIHMEAARMMQFTEEEFSKTIELGQRM